MPMRNPAPNQLQLDLAACYSASSAPASAPTGTLTAPPAEAAGTAPVIQVTIANAQIIHSESNTTIFGNFRFDALLKASFLKVTFRSIALGSTALLTGSTAPAHKTCTPGTITNGWSVETCWLAK